jgi:hypothetical protein
MKFYHSILFGFGLVGIFAILMTGCTENARSRIYGGTMTIDLPANQKLVNATWKESQVWYLTRPMRSNEVAETFTFQEKSSFGVVEGTVKFVENK